MSLESPSQIQYEPIIDPSSDLSPSTENEPGSFSAISYNEFEGAENKVQYRDIEPASNESLKQSEPMIKQNILENDIFDASYSSSNENEDDDSDSKFSTIKRSPYSKNNIAEENERGELSRQNTVIENVHYKKETNGTATLDGELFSFIVRLSICRLRNITFLIYFYYKLSWHNSIIVELDTITKLVLRRSQY